MNNQKSKGKYIFAVICVLILGFAALGLALYLNSAKPEPTPVPEPPIEVAENVHEYGEAQSNVDNSEALHIYIQFPETNIKPVDEAIAQWVQAISKNAKDELETMQKSNSTANAEINVQYNSFLLSQSYASVEELGFYSNSQMAHPNDFFKVFNIDIANGRIIENEDILDYSRSSEITRLILGKLQKIDADITSQDSSHWLEDIILTKDGIDVMFSRGEALPSSLGSQRVHLSRAELGSLLKINIEEALPPPTTTAPPTTTPPPTSTTTTKAKPKTTQPATEPTSPDDSNDNNAADDSDLREFPKGTKVIAITFDDGPSKITPQLLKLFADNGGRATFFVVGNRVNSNKSTIKAAVAQHCEVAGHSWDHKELTKLTESELTAELKSTNDAITAVSGIKPKFYRPPYGATNDRVKAVSKAQGMAMINWSVDTEDWKSRNADSVYKEIMAKSKSGSIVLCHDLYQSTFDAVARAVPELRAQGYELVTVSEYMKFMGTKLTPGEIYRGKY
ncbi:MAG: polysaccharide deacetylase family protein [Oscillospiraceae bacterium]|jgi:peptidoglycan/xylan/chitin deacetylase (PgdA/CDA1 family)|nr:polysaccharide deacetylase family protein [Oscillospiraceae bacterium]